MGSLRKVANKLRHSGPSGVVASGYQRALLWLLEHFRFAEPLAYGSARSAKATQTELGSGSGSERRIDHSERAHYCNADEKSRLLALVPPALRRKTVAAADEILAGQFTFKNVTHRFRGEVDWLFQPDGSHVGWRYDLNRHFFLLTVARAFLYTGDERYLCRVSQIVEDWTAKNPCRPRQPNWDSPFEVAARLCNWTLLYRLLCGVESDHARLTAQKLLRGIVVHAKHVSCLIEIHVPNNHLLLEAKALYSASLLFKGGPFGAGLQKKAFRHLRAQVGRQIQSDGGHFEQSIGYHRIICSELLDLLFHCERSGDTDVVDLLRGPLLSMTEFLLAMLRPDGTLPCIGDTSATDTYYRFNPFMMAAVLAQRSEFKRAAALLGEDDLTLLSLGASGAETYSGLGMEPLRGLSRSFPESGYYVINDDNRVHVVIDCGPFCTEKAPFHAHDDILSFDVSMEDGPLFVDGGTDGVPSDNAAATPWRRYFKGAASHNVIMLDGRDRSRFDEASWALRVAKPRDRYWHVGEKVVYFAGSHDGYARTLNAIHRREVVLVRGEFLCIVDRVCGAGSHDIDLFYHLASDKRAIDKGGGLIAIEDDAGYVAQLTISGPGGSLEVVRGRKEAPVQGWVSAESGGCVAADTIQFRARRELPFVAISLLQGGKSPRFSVERSPGRATCGDDSAAFFRISNGVATYECVSATEPVSMRVGDKELQRSFGILRRDVADGLEVLFSK